MPGQTVVAEGVGFANAIGKVLEVWQLGASRDQLSQVQLPPGPGPGGNRSKLYVRLDVASAGLLRPGRSRCPPLSARSQAT
ncbi:MAG: hypothetical protein WA709_16000 [Stellaceae bacterium]